MKPSIPLPPGCATVEEARELAHLVFRGTLLPLREIDARWRGAGMPGKDEFLAMESERERRIA